MAFHLAVSLRKRLTKSSIPQRRYYSGASNGDIRQKLMFEIKTAMKNKDTIASTTLRSVLSDVYAADKASSETVGSSTIVSIIRKAALCRSDAASQFVKASREDLADKEQREASILSSLLPPLLSETEISRVLKEVILEQSVSGDTPGKAFGRVTQAFYSRVDKSHVDPALVKKTAEALLSSLPKA